MNKHLSPDVDFRLVPLGATPTKEGCYFAVWSPNARSIVITSLIAKKKSFIKQRYLKSAVVFGMAFYLMLL